MRCLATAETLAWASWKIGFVSSAETLETVPALACSGFPVSESKESDPIRADLIVFDHYGIDATAERRLAGETPLRVAFEDRPIRAHDVDLLVDPTPGRQADSYRDLLPPKTELLGGMSYVQLRRQWRMARETRSPKIARSADRRRVLVSMGSTDPTNATARVLAALASLDLALDIDVVLGPKAPHISAVRAMTGAKVCLHIDPPDLPSLVANADLAIGAAGSSCFERACLGVPSIIVALADNQVDLAKAFDQAGAACAVAGSQLEDIEGFSSFVSRLLGDDDARKFMSKRAVDLVDGRGTQRLLLRLGGRMDVSGGGVSLRAAEQGDCDWMFELQCRPETRRFARNQNPPTATEHVVWYGRTLSDPDRLLAVVEKDHSSVGIVRLDRLSDEKPAFEVSIAICPTWYGRGIGSATLNLVRKIVPGADLIAIVHPDNRASQSLFVRAGYRRVAEDRFKNSVP